MAPALKDETVGVKVPENMFVCYHNHDDDGDYNHHDGIDYHGVDDDDDDGDDGGGPSNRAVIIAIARTASSQAATANKIG